jgi:very-short-patch-repair endonuclease
MHAKTSAQSGGMNRDLERDLARFGGVARRDALVRLGHTAHSLRKGIAAGVAVVPRRGWLCATSVPPDRRRAVELGGKLGGSSALASYGVWVDGGNLVVAMPSGASGRAPIRPGEVRTWGKERFPKQGAAQWRVSVQDALLQLAVEGDTPSLVASIDSALYTRQLSASDLPSLIGALPRHLRHIRSIVDGRSMSGTETKLRLACIRAGLRVAIQVPIERVGTVDLLIDEWLIIEVDSHKHHDEPIQQHKDRIRDGNAVLGRFGELRFDYQLVQFELAWCIDVILAQLACGPP